MPVANLSALAARIRDLRLERSWSQEHLAGAAGLSLRTVQRVEGGYASSSDTLLALAAAFDVPATELTKLIPAPESAEDRVLGLTAKQAVWIGLAAALPAFLFVAANISIVLWNANLADLYLDAVAAPFGLDSPVIILGGLALGVLLNAMQIVRFEIRRPGVGLTIDHMQLRLTLGPVLVLLVGGACMAVLGTYLVAENLGHFISGFIGQ